MYTVSNKHLRISVSATGAELQSIQSVADDIEFLWQGDPDIWSGRSPILFPIVGSLKDGSYFFDQKAYFLPRHGLARTTEFRQLDSGSANICLELTSDADTQKVYPWDFRLKVRYSLRYNCIDIDYEVLNTGSTPMRFAIGSHPAFRLPQPLELYSIYFSSPEDLLRFPLDENGLLAEVGSHYELNNQRIPLHKSLFDKDALVFKDVKSTEISLYDETAELVRVHTGGAPHLGIWAKPAAPYVCIEPWFGYSDSSNASGQWEDKPAMQTLQPADVFSTRWTIEIVSVSR